MHDPRRGGLAATGSSPTAWPNRSATTRPPPQSAISFSTAGSPSQIVLCDGRGADGRGAEAGHLPHPQQPWRPAFLSTCWPAARMPASPRSTGCTSPRWSYLPAELGYEGKRPLVVYIHGGPQGQEGGLISPGSRCRSSNSSPWKGLAVFVPNVRGSTGYGLNYTKRVDRDWGGADRLDHVAGLESLADHPRVDTGRGKVVGRSYGGYMTLMQGGMTGPVVYAVDMFGPYNLITFYERIPATWKPYFGYRTGQPRTRTGSFCSNARPAPTCTGWRARCYIQGRNDPRGRRRVGGPGPHAPGARQGCLAAAVRERGPRRDETREQGAVLYGDCGVLCCAIEDVRLKIEDSFADLQ